MNMDITPVAEFMRAAKQVVPSTKTRVLYGTLVQEEFEEWQTAENNEKEFDACLDLIWVIIGYMHSRGYPIEAGWAEVVRSNMDKVKDGPIFDRYGKVQKPEGWEGPKLKGLV